MIYPLPNTLSVRSVYTIYYIQTGEKGQEGNQRYQEKTFTYEH